MLMAAIVVISSPKTTAVPLAQIGCQLNSSAGSTFLMRSDTELRTRSSIASCKMGLETSDVCAALNSTVVSQHNFWVNHGKGRPDDASFTRLLLDRGADPDVRASLKARLEEGHGGGPLREYRDVTALGWGERYDAKLFVSRESLRLIESRGGRR